MAIYRQFIEIAKKLNTDMVRIGFLSNALDSNNQNHSLYILEANSRSFLTCIKVITPTTGRSWKADAG